MRLCRIIAVWTHTHTHTSVHTYIHTYMLLSLSLKIVMLNFFFFFFEKWFHTAIDPPHPSTSWGLSWTLLFLSSSCIPDPFSWILVHPSARRDEKYNPSNLFRACGCTLHAWKLRTLVPHCSLTSTSNFRCTVCMNEFLNNGRPTHRWTRKLLISFIYIQQRPTYVKMINMQYYWVLRQQLSFYDSQAANIKQCYTRHPLYHL